MLRRYVMMLVVLCAVLFSASCKQTVTVGSSVTYNPMTGWTLKISVSVKIDPAGTDLSAFDASQALANFAWTNAEMTSTGGYAEVTVTDPASGAVLGQQSFQYTVSGNSVYAADPTALHNWLSGFSGYSSVDVGVGIPVAGQDTQTSGTGSVTAASEYQGTTYSSASASWPIAYCTRPCAE